MAPATGTDTAQRSLALVDLSGLRPMINAPIDGSIKPVSIIISTILGIAVQILGMAVAWHFYDLRNSAAFTFRNHLISELGWSEHSPKAAIFDAGISLGSVFFLPVLVAMGKVLPMRLRSFAWAFGVWAVLGGVGAGICPMAKNLLPHLTAASLFFTGWFVTVSFFTFALRRDPVWRALVIVGAVCILLAGLYAISFAIEARELLKVFHSGPRSEIFWSAINEWTVLLSFYVWTIVASVKLAKHHCVSR